MTLSVMNDPMEAVPAHGKSERHARVGIAIPAYRAAETLQSTLQSCIAQTLADWIAFVTVDGDDFAAEQEIVDRLNDPRIHLEWNGRCLGQFENFNRAMLRCYAAGTRWIKLLCADDLLRPDALERMVALGEQSPRCGLVYGYYDWIDGEGKVISCADLSRIRSQIVPSRKFVITALPAFNPMGGPSSVMLRSNVIERCGIFDARLNYSGESDLWFRVVTQFDVGVVGEHAVLDYRFHQNSITGRGGFSVHRFEQPLDIARALSSRLPPLSREWFMAQALIGKAVASNCLTVLAFVRRGELRAALAGLAASLRRLSPVAAPVALLDFVERLILVALGRHPARSNPFAPPEREICK